MCYTVFCFVLFFFTEEFISNRSYLAQANVHVYSFCSALSENSAAAFTVGVVPSPVQVGVPFVVPLQFMDAFNNPTSPPSDTKPQLESRYGVEITQTNVWFYLKYALRLPDHKQLTDALLSSCSNKGVNDPSKSSLVKS